MWIGMLASWPIRELIPLPHGSGECHRDPSPEHTASQRPYKHNNFLYNLNSFVFGIEKCRLLLQQAIEVALHIVGHFEYYKYEISIVVVVFKVVGRTKTVKLIFWTGN